MFTKGLDSSTVCLVNHNLKLMSVVSQGKDITYSQAAGTSRSVNVAVTEAAAD